MGADFREKLDGRGSQN